MSEYKIKKGFDINARGKAELQIVELEPPKKVAVQPPEFRGIKPKLDVEVGDQVRIGSSLFRDKTNPDLKFTSPLSGKVTAINRGERRVITEIVIESDGKHDHEKFTVIPKDKIANANNDDIIANMLKAGIWPLIRQRPFSKIANYRNQPRDIFISGMDTAPLASDINFIMQGLDADFQHGIDILAKLTDGKIYLSVDGKNENIASAFINAKNVEINSFSGPHPAGNVGVHIHHIKPIKQQDVVWYVNPYAVALIGKFFRTGVYPTERIIAIAGSVLKERKYFKTHLGAPIGSLITEGNIDHPEVRFISGNILTGRKIQISGYTGFYDNLISVIPEGAKEKKLLGWYRPGTKMRSRSRTYLSTWLGKKEFDVDTLLNGGNRAFIMTGDYEQVLPMDIYPVQLVKSILVEDIEEMEALGILEVDEDDVALCSYICPSKYDFGTIIRQGQDLIEKEG